MIDICSRSHHHFESRNHFIASTAISSSAEQSEKKRPKNSSYIFGIEYYSTEKYHILMITPQIEKFAFEYIEII